MTKHPCRNAHRRRDFRVSLLLVTAAALLAATTGAALAQTTGIDSIPTLYRLDKGSQYQEGCFGPCLCAVLLSEAAKGTFVLTPTGYDGLFTYYAVTDVNWLIALGGTDTFVTGSGTYRIGGEFALQQELTLDLQVGDDKVQHYSSGLLTGPAPFPTIDMTITRSDQTCFGSLFHVTTSPVPPEQVRPYRLLDGSTFQRGCFGACDCLVGPLQPIVGHFALVPLASAAPWSEFGVVDARWRVLSSSLSTTMSDSIPVRGAGFYTFGGDGPIQQRLELLLKVDGETPAHFDSGLVPGGDAFPRIDARISVNGAVCYDTLIDLHAAPRKTVLRFSERTDGDAP